MAISVTDLPPKYQAQAMKKYMKQQALRGPMPSDAPAHDQPKGPKYHNKPTERVTTSGAVLRFDSQKEARRYDTLIERERAGLIRDLRLQADFTYYKPPDMGGAGSHAAYWADQSRAPWVLVVEDVKSKATRTKEYLLKRKMMKDRLRIEIIEV